MYIFTFIQFYQIYHLFDVNKPSGNINLTHKELTEKESKHLKKAFA